MQIATRLAALGCTLAMTCGLSTAIAQRPTLQATNDPRADILPHPIWDSIPEYRRVYNRPRHIGGWIAYKISPTSQEAMVWEENYRAGRYDQKHAPAVYRRYYAPKPWEVLQIGPRPDFTDEPSEEAYESIERPEEAEARRGTTPAAIVSIRSQATSSRKKISPHPNQH
jgi:hypothetical protein